MPLVGGTGPTQEADDDIRVICEQVKGEVQEKTGKNYEVFKPLKYRQQLVNGINYFIKVHVGGSDHLHIRVHKSFQGVITLSSFQDGKLVEEEIEYF